MRFVLAFALIFVVLTGCSGRNPIDRAPSFWYTIDPPDLVYVLGKKVEITMAINTKAIVPVEVKWPTDEAIEGGLEITKDKSAEEPDVLKVDPSISFPTFKILDQGSSTPFEFDITDQLKENLEEKDQIVYIRWRIGSKTSVWYRLVVIHDYTAEVQTGAGNFSMEFFPAEAPETVIKFVERAKDGFYDGSPVRKIEKGSHMLAGPDVEEDLRALPQEANHQDESFGHVAMHYDLKPDSATHLFTIRFKARQIPQPPLVVFAKVTAGEDVLRTIEAMPVGEDKAPAEPLKIDKIEVKVKE